MIRLLKVLSIAGCLSLLATPASAIPFGVEANAGLGYWTIWNNGSPVSSSVFTGSRSGSFNVDPGLVSWNIGLFFCPCSWSMTQGGTTIAGGSIRGENFGSFIFGRTIISATEETALKVREPTMLALLGLALFGVWFATQRRNRLH